MDDRILERLRLEFELARQELASASAHFDSILVEVPSGLPHPDGQHRVQNASRAVSEARKKLMAATTRLNKFVVNGTVPPEPS